MVLPVRDCKIASCNLRASPVIRLPTPRRLCSDVTTSESARQPWSVEQISESPEKFLDELAPTSDAIYEMIMQPDPSADTTCRLHQRAAMTVMTMPPISAVTTLDDLMLCLDIAGARGDVDSVSLVLAELDQRGQQLDVYGWTRALGAAATAGDVKSAFGIMSQMREAGVRGSARTHTQLLRACCKGGEVDKALSLFNTLRDNNDQAADVVMYTVMMDGMIEQGRTDEAWQLLYDMQQAAIELDSVGFTVLMKGCIHQSEVERALGLMDHMSQDGKQPTKVTYNTLINVCATRIDTFDRAVEWFNRMETDGHLRDEHSYRAMQRACATAGEVAYLENIIDELNQVQIPRDQLSYSLEAQTYATAIRQGGNHDHNHAAYCVQQADGVLTRMTDKQLQPNKFTVSALLSVFISAPRPNRAMQLLCDPQWVDSVAGWPNVKNCNAVLRCLAKVKQPDKALQVLHWMDEQQIQPDQESWQHLLKAALARQAVQPLIQLLGRMQQDGVMMPSGGRDADKIRERLAIALDQVS